MMKRVNFSYKKATFYATNRNSKKSTEERINAVKEICEHLRSPRKFMSVDETEFGRNTIPLFGYAKLEKRAIIRGSAAPNTVICKSPGTLFIY